MKRAPQILLVAWLLGFGAPCAVAERSAAEWRSELGERYAELDSFVAHYRLKKPGKPGLGATLAENRETGAALVRVHTGVADQGAWFVPGKKRGSLFMRSEGRTALVKGYSRMIDQLAGMNEVFGGKKLEANPDHRAYLLLEPEALKFGVGFQLGPGLAWFDAEFVEEIEKIDAGEERVRFTFANGDWMEADPKTGMLCRQEIAVEGGARQLWLDKLEMIEAPEDYAKEEPEVGEGEAKTIDVSDSPVALSMHRKLFQLVARGTELGGVGREEIDRFLEDRRVALVSYWDISLGGNLPAMFPPDLVKDLREEAILPIRDRLLKSSPKLRDAPEEEVFQLIKEKFTPALAKSLRDKADELPFLRGMGMLLAREGVRLGEDRKEIGAVIAKHLFETYLESLAGVMIDQAWDVDLD